MPSLYFLKFAPASSGVEIVGSSQDSKHPHWIDLLSFAQRVTNVQMTGQWSRERGQPPSEVLCTTADVAAMAKLYEACAKGCSYDSVTLEAANADGRVFLRTLLTTVTVDSCQTGNSSDRARLLVQFSLGSATMEIKYFGAGPPMTTIIGGTAGAIAGATTGRTGSGTAAGGKAASRPYGGR